MIAQRLYPRPDRVADGQRFTFRFPPVPPTGLPVTVVPSRQLEKCAMKAVLVEDDSDPLGTLDLATHKLPLDEAPHGYDIFQKKADECIKVVLKP
jgi:hypothetical protein